jgi:hypothetical protein
MKNRTYLYGYKAAVPPGPGGGCIGYAFAGKIPVSYCCFVSGFLLSYPPLSNCMKSGTETAKQQNMHAAAVQSGKAGTSIQGISMEPAGFDEAQSLQESAGNSAQVKQLQAYAQMANATAPVQLVRMPPVQRQAVIQRKTVGEVNAALTAKLAQVNAINTISETSMVPAITAQQGRLAGLPAEIAALARDVTEQGGDAVTELGALDRRVAAINTREPELNADIAAGSGPAPPAPTSAWGAGRGAHAAWKAKSDKLADNRKELQTITAERGTLTGQRPVSVLKDMLSQITAQYGRLQENLEAAERQRYFFLLMTTVTPTKVSHKYEGVWESGESDLGVFVFDGPDKIQDIPKRVGRVEVHIHFSHGTRTINRAHIKSGWTYTILSGGGAPWYAATALASCVATV